ncbi:tRNA (N(6)-L-threonylcarbamoyladenosine(37)-C(2))-methylthiotransferase MtaB [Carboxylicivirga mesophila]|uniref:tRNA (N(6)-L-threonylcarbamoyladenosine(37)-C(2))-methylthiotransferase MtaB n=1 Tax=Carboxylicivirga mesophila TaxID=1166478 RepID=A0ABS5KC06_9BACT|nr:tRNA (N(6)-L-threonylcarbamoyladenosine(37)-C(2))-methylthiotransferase MtaB [Carboxylicivirga mesophila]MBS2212412.1 tRNA (N(6)-L-threonylcarbamoyladenosine(37)-C(2))-methylthiotransferase MtaB [Carboxylicivirga mesophila]
MKKRIGFKTLGCRLNQFETDALASKFVGLGYEVVENSKDIDVFIVNTCTVTNQSDQKSRYVVNNALNHGHTGMLVITGCMANHHKEQLEKRYPNAYVVDNQQKSTIPQLVEAHYNKEILPSNQNVGGVFDYAPAAETFHTRSMIKIQDGCDNYCTFCIIPKVRGRAVSRPVEDILENIRQVVGFGYKEVVITGVNISRYNDNGIGFSALLKQIVDINLDFRVRISSIEPDSFDEAFFELLKHPKITPHLHLCLQSASESVLLQMRRMYTYKLYKRMVERLRAVDPRFNITTDIIVGFPGETEADFQKSLEAVEELNFGHVHTFKYSKREDTRAARMSNTVPESEKSLRSEQLRQAANDSKINYRQQFVGDQLKVLVDTVKDGYSKGYGEYYVPVKINQVLERNKLYTVKITGIETWGEEPNLIGVVQN